jgi:hypothetical protein
MILLCLFYFSFLSFLFHAYFASFKKSIKTGVHFLYSDYNYKTKAVIADSFTAD